jgi:aspartate carbamoyltransferase catalytic subunit
MEPHVDDETQAALATMRDRLVKMEALSLLNGNLMVMLWPHLVTKAVIGFEASENILDTTALFMKQLHSDNDISQEALDDCLELLERLRLDATLVRPRQPQSAEGSSANGNGQSKH